MQVIAKPLGSRTPRSYEVDKHQRDFIANPACAHFALVVGIAALLAGCSATQQPAGLTPTDVESQVRASLLVWNTADAERIIETPGPGGNFGGAGFGYRTIAHRAGQSREEELSIINRFLDSVEYYRVTVDEVNTMVEHDVGFAWGYFTEDFQLRGRPPETVRVRFTSVLSKGPTGWRQLMFHRDAQPFDNNGTYIPQPTARPPGAGG